MMQSEKRILHFAQDGDTSGFFPQLALRHDRSRYRMFFGTLNPMAPWLREYMISKGVDCFSCECRRRSQYPGAMLRLARYLRKCRIDILHTHLFEPSVIGLTTGLLARTPVRVMTRHYSDYHTRIEKSWHVRLDKLCAKLCDRVIAVSQHAGDHIIGEEGASSDKVLVVLNGIDFDRVRTSGPDFSDRVRREFAAEHAHLLVIIARLHPEKGHHYLFQALPEIRRRVRRPVRLVVAGEGPFEAAYTEEVRALGCEDMVIFTGFRHDAPDLMAASDIVVLPSVAEAFGLVLTEALYLGTPVVATRVGGIPEIVEDGVDGTLVVPGDSAALAEAIITLLSDSQRLESMRGAGREKVINRFQFERMVRAYEALYERMTDTRKATPGDQTPVQFTRKPERTDS